MPKPSTLVCLSSCFLIISLILFRWSTIKSVFKDLNVSASFQNEQIDTHEEISQGADDLCDLAEIVSKNGFDEVQKDIEELALDRSAIKVEVQNGSGGMGAACIAAKVLEDKGYPQISTRNATSFSYETSVIRVKDEEDSDKLAEMILEDFNDQYAFTIEKTLAPASLFDAVVIIGLE